MNPENLRGNGFYDASRRLGMIGDCILNPTMDRMFDNPLDGSFDNLQSFPYGEPVAPPAVCEDGTAATDIKVRVVYYDALAIANGVYHTMGATAQTVETNAAAVTCRIGTTDQVTAADGTTTFANLPANNPYTIELTNFSAAGAGAAYMSIHTDCGRIHTANAAVPRHRTSFQVDKGATYTIRIWLRPKTIVLHWTAGSRRISDSTRSFYHFVIDGSGDAQLGGRVNDDPRFWRHNLYIQGMPANAIQGLSNNNLLIHNALGSVNNRDNYYEWNAGRTAVVAVDASGYGKHAGGYNTNSTGVSVCAMSGSVLNGAIAPANAMTDAQVDGLVEHVASLCNAWHMDATDPDDVCTHFEVDHLHRTDPVHKWDITWLPEGKQDDYRDANTQELCATEADEFDHTQHIDVAVGAGYTSGETNTDRVSAYLRELIDAAM